MAIIVADMNRLDALLNDLGRTDVYLLDQFMRGRLATPGRVLDAGPGSGRNLDLFLRGGHEVWIADRKELSIERTREHAAGLGFPIPDDRVIHGPIEDGLPPESFDVVLSIAVLHFATDPGHWRAMVDAMWESLAPGGIFFARLTSSIGIEKHVTPLGDGRYRQGDGTDRYLVTLDDLLRTTDDLGGELLDPVKTVNVQNLRCMTTWVVTKSES